MSLDSDIAVLGRVPLFADLTGEQVRLIAFSAEPVNLADGAVLFREGERADCGYVVLSGTIVLSAEGEEGEPARVGAGRFLGEMALITDSQRPATAVAEGRCEVIRVRRALFQRMMNEYPDIAVRIRDRLAQRVRQTGAEMARVGLRLAALGDE